MTRGTDMDAVVVRSREERKKPTDIFTLLEYPSKNGKPAWVTIRLFGPVFSEGTYWVRAKRDNPKSSFPAPCLSYDYNTHQRTSDKEDPWGDELQRERDAGMDQPYVRYQPYLYMNAIVRKEQSREPARNRLTAEEKETGFKDKDSDSWTPVVVVRFTPSLFKKVQDLKDDNIVKLKSGTKAFNVNHERFGRDIMIRYDPNAAASDKYAVKLVVDGGRTPLTEEEKAYLKWDIEAMYNDEPSLEETKRDVAAWRKRMGLTDEKSKAVESMDDNEESFDDDIEDTPKLKKRKPAADVFEDDDVGSFDPPKKSKSDDDDFDDDDDDFEDEKPTRKSKKSKQVEEDDFEDDDFEEEAPRKKSKAKPVEEDDFDDDDFDDDEEDEKPARKSKSKKVEEDDFDDDDFEDDEEEDKPIPKSKKPLKSKFKKAKPVDDDDDFDDEDF